MIPTSGRPVYHAVTAANVNDISAAKEMPIEAGGTYVFDLGYYDFGFLANLDALGCRLVTRFKTNTPFNQARDNAAGAGIERAQRPDRLSARPPSQEPQEPDEDAVREIVVKTQTGKTLRLLTNDLDAPADEIADLYKRRWQIELFFRADEADVQDHEVHRAVGKRGAHPDRRGADRLSSAARPAADRQRNPRLPRTRSTRARQSHAPKRRRSTPKSPAAPPLDSKQLQLRLTLT